MSAGARVAAFAALLVTIFAAAALAGHAVDPGTGTRKAHRGGHLARTQGAADGLATSRSGYRLVAANTRFAAGRTAVLRLRIVDARDNTVRAFETEQGRRMHVVIVRRDLRRYQHLHPKQATDGTWRIALRLPEAGVYRAFADFRIGGAQYVLGVDLFVPGDFVPLKLPATSDRASIDGYEVRLHAHGAGELTFAVTRAGRAITDLQPYLGAYGHLVALRDGDLAYRHAHPLGSHTGEIAFAAGATTPGIYRLFLQFRHADRVHTAAFTR